jgi:hypothetical protein
MISFNQDNGDFSQRILNLYLNNLANKDDNVSFTQRPSNSTINLSASEQRPYHSTTNLSAGEQILNKLSKNINSLYFLTKSLVNIPDYEFNEEEQKKAVENEIKNINIGVLQPRVDALVKPKVEYLTKHPTKEIMAQIKKEIKDQKITDIKSFREKRKFELAKEKVVNDKEFIDSAINQARNDEIELIIYNSKKHLKKEKSTIGSQEEYVTLKDSLIHYLKFAKDVNKNIEDIYPVLHTLPHSVLNKYEIEFKRLKEIQTIFKAFK